jgi:tRNA U34 5-methylaminomethyl-2-thiouridine-forming methyltransferase MnmC
MPNLVHSHLKEMPTQDGTITLYNERFKEACHSTDGATNETITHYIKGCELIEKARVLDQINILEMGFGTGNGFITTLNQLQNLHCKVNFISLEIDIENIKWAIKHYPELAKLNLDENLICASFDNIELKIFIGDARETIKLLGDYKFDCIYQDAFSPKRNPRLWTVEWFKDLKHLSKTDTIMSTYSASSSIRKSMHKAGWSVYNGVKFGKKRSSTRATLNGETQTEILQQFERSPAITITDANAEEYRKKDD